jgi:isopenicillin N synthase-like dioxygenase
MAVYGASASAYPIYKPDNSNLIDKPTTSTSSKKLIKDTQAKAEIQTVPLIINEPVLFLENAAIPLFDLDAIDRMSGQERAEHVKKFVDALEYTGFVAVKAESLTPMIAAVEEVMQKYFRRTPEEKMQDWNLDNSKGYSNRGRETAAGSHVADLKETFFVPPGFKQWPKGMPDFEKAIEPYRQKLTHLAIQVMQLIAESAGESSQDVAACMQTAYNLLRLAFYPAKKSGDDAEAVWAAPHTDLNAITLLPPSKVPGLQLITKEGEWKAVSVPEDYLIVNTGEQLERKTAGYISATLHQVLNPGGQYEKQNRYASIFFASWPQHFSLAPFKSSQERVMSDPKIIDKDEHLSKFKDVTVKDNLDSRLIEMGTMQNPSEDLVVHLRSLRLLQKPPRVLTERFPQHF